MTQVSYQANGFLGGLAFYQVPSTHIRRWALVTEACDFLQTRSTYLKEALRVKVDNSPFSQYEKVQVKGVFILEIYNFQWNLEHPMENQE